MRFAPLITAVLFAFFGLFLFFYVRDVKTQIAHLKQTPSETSLELPCLYVNASVLNVREHPTTSSKVINTLPRNTQICEYSRADGGFVRIKDGFIAGEFLSLSETKMSFDNAQSRSNLSPLPPPRETKINLQITKDPSKLSQKEVLEAIRGARAALLAGDFTQAKNLALKANKTSPQNAQTWEIFARALAAEGYLDEAQNVLQEAIEKAPLSPASREQLDAVLKELQ